MNNTLMCHRGEEKKLSVGLSGKQCLSYSRHTDLEDEDGYNDEEVDGDTPTISPVLSSPGLEK